jgi:hypothetical protein
MVNGPRRTSLFLALLAAAACGPAAPPAQPPPSSQPAPAPALAVEDDPAASSRIAADVALLASDPLRGRGTGDEGARLAADFVTKRFTDLQLVPDGDRVEGAPAKYTQAFEARVGAEVKRAELVVALDQRRAIVMGDAGNPKLRAADGTATGEASGEVVFVGYGITSPAASWDDYAGADVVGKVAVVLDGVPDASAGGAQNQLRDFGSVRYKLRTAREHKAAAAIVVSTKTELLAAAMTDTSDMGIPAIVVTREFADGFFPKLDLRKDPTWHPAHAGKPTRVDNVERVTVRTQVAPIVATAWNIAARLPAREGAPHADEVVVVGAHYDHLGFGGQFSMAPGVHAIHPGADDNASGTALLLEVARRLAALPARPDRNILFLAFGAEEIGAIGSRYWVQHPSVPVDHVVAMINADMVGRMNEDHLVIDGVGTSPGWKPLVDEAAKGLGLNLAFGAEGFGASDHASFTAVRVPVAFLFTGAHPDYHKPSDTADKINAVGEARIVTLAARLALALAQAPSRLTFVDAPADPHRGMRGGFKVSLGTIPDYAFNGKGVRLDGVRPDAPAARAGLARGDVIVKVGPHEIGNIHDYMFALGELEAGKKVVIEVERDGKRVPLEVIPAPGR